MKHSTSAKQYLHDLHGFTLVELLVTITIILVLAALSMAGFTRVRLSAYQMQSMGNMTQLMVANTSFAADNSGKYVWLIGYDSSGVGLPGSAEWTKNTEFLKNYRGDPLPGHEDECPLAMLDVVITKAKQTGYTLLGSSYGYNSVNMPDGPKGKFSGGGASGGDISQKMSFSINQLTNPSLTACFMTATDMEATYSEDGKGAIAFRHNDKCLVVYYDGHVSALSKADMKTLTPSGVDKKTLPFWNASCPNVFP
jgi:prepilin-type N-terminal cleavage/methylation domain-containing protein/prepilin-type processing-associated H-X9-DG protein